MSGFVGWLGQVDSLDSLLVVASWYPAEAAAAAAVLIALLGIVLLLVGGIGVWAWRRADARQSIAPTSAPPAFDPGLAHVGAE